MHKPLSQENHKIIVKQTALAAAIDLRPFSFGRGIGFLNLVQSIINIAAVHGKFNISSYSPYGSTVVNNLNKIVTEVKSILTKKFEQLNYLSVIIDHWTNKYDKSHFFGMAVR